MRFRLCIFIMFWANKDGGDGDDDSDDFKCLVKKITSSVEVN